MAWWRDYKNWTQDPKTGNPRKVDSRTQGPKDARTHGPKDPGTQGPKDPGTQGPKDPRTQRRKDPWTQGPKDPRTLEPKDHGPEDQRPGDPRNRDQRTKNPRTPRTQGPKDLGPEDPEFWGHCNSYRTTIQTIHVNATQGYICLLCCWYAQQKTLFISNYISSDFFDAQSNLLSVCHRHLTLDFSAYI